MIVLLTPAKVGGKSKFAGGGIFTLSRQKTLASRLCGAIFAWKGMIVLCKW